MLTSGTIHFLAEGIPDIAAALAKRNIGFVLRRFPEHSLLRFCDEVKASLVIGHENPTREPEAWRHATAKRLKIPLWTIDADVIVPSKLLERHRMRRTLFVCGWRQFRVRRTVGARTLASHGPDHRPLLYTERQLENGETHDQLWNAAQMQMLSTAWMHNYMRMYWAKKILDWSRSPAEAHRLAVRLNDKYELDGRDPNGRARNCLAIMGKFDRPWFERPIFGQIRYLSDESTGRKFNRREYIRQNLP